MGGDWIVVKNVHQNRVFLANAPPMSNDALPCAVVELGPQFPATAFFAMPEFVVHVKNGACLD